MSNLLLPTLSMMALTFIIGFFVAAIIKLIAYWADSLDFHHTHQEEIQRIKRLRKVHQRMVAEFIMESSADQNNPDKRDAYSRGINDDPAENKPAGYYHGVSHGSSKMDLLDYYYPNDTNLVFLKNEEQILKRKNKPNSAKK